MTKVKEVTTEVLDTDVVEKEKIQVEGEVVAIDDKTVEIAQQAFSRLFEKAGKSKAWISSYNAQLAIKLRKFHALENHGNVRNASGVQKTTNEMQ